MTKKVKFDIDDNIRQDICKNPCLCIGCLGCSVKNHHCNRFTNYKCGSCFDSICLDCQIKLICKDCIDIKEKDNEKKEDKDIINSYQSIIEGYDIMFNINNV